MDETPIFQIQSFDPLDSGKHYATVKANDGEYIYVPEEFVTQGRRVGETQYFDQAFLNRDYLSKLLPTKIDEDLLYDSLKEAGYKNPASGFLIKKEDFEKYDPDPNSITYYNAVGKFSGPVQGLAEKDGQLIYALAGNGGSSYGWIDQGGTPWEWTQGKPKFGKLGQAVNKVGEIFADIPFGPEIAGLLTGNPYVYATLKGAQAGYLGEDPIKAGLKAGATVAAAGALDGAFGGEPISGGTGAFDIAGNPDILGGSSAVSLGNVAGAFDMGGAPEVMNAPISQATPVPAEQLQYPGVEVQPTYTPAPGSLQEALPEFGVQTQATTPPYTAVPGSFDAAVAGGLLTPATVAGGASVTDTLRAANLANNLMNAPQQPTPNPNAQPQQQMAPGGVDYSGLLALLQQRPGTTGLLGTRFQPQSYNLLSLLG